MVVVRARTEDACLRQQMADRYEEKMLRGDVLQLQRSELLSQMAGIRKEMLSQEAVIKGAIETMHRTGRLDLPPELEQLHQTVRAETAACSLGAGRKALAFGGPGAGEYSRSGRDGRDGRYREGGMEAGQDSTDRRGDRASVGSEEATGLWRSHTGRVVQPQVRPNSARGRPGSAASQRAPQGPLDTGRAGAGGQSTGRSRKARSSGAADAVGVTVADAFSLLSGLQAAHMRVLSCCSQHRRRLPVCAWCAHRPSL